MIDTELANDFARQVAQEAEQVIRELIKAAGMQAGQIIIVGGSTSEIAGEKIGTSSNLELARGIIQRLKQECDNIGVYLAVQCCEHLNRALVVERDCAEAYRLERVNVNPALKAGGAFATSAKLAFDEPVVVEFIQAHAGIDIGNTFIGMHLKHVAVPLRPTQKTIGQALVTMARTRAKYIGGSRAVYDE